MQEEDPELRTHEAHLKLVQDVQNSGRVSELGVKGYSTLLDIKNFDIVWNLPTDYMHQTLLGVTKQLFKVWQETIFSKADLNKLRERMSHLKLNRDLPRNLRFLDFWRKFKASEWEIWLLFVSLCCLHGILPDDKFQSYSRLVHCIYTLLKESITKDEIDDCELKMLQFVGESEIEYGIDIMSFNLHGHLHFAQNVRKTGPLWANSAFPFENAIGKFLKQINAPNGAIIQVAKKWMKKCTFKNHIENNKSNSKNAVDFCKSLFDSRPPLEEVTRISDDIILVGIGVQNKRVENLMNKFLKKPTSITVYDRFLYKSVAYHTVNYTRVQKTNDSVVETSTGQIIEMHYVVKFENNCYVCGCEWLIGPNDFNLPNEEVFAKHLLKVVEKKSEYTIFKVDKIRRKVLVIDNGTKVHVSFKPNNYQNY